MSYKNNLRLEYNKLKEVYEEDIRLINTNIIMYIIRSGLYKTIFQTTEDDKNGILLINGVLLINTKGDELNLVYNKGILCVGLSIGGDNYIDITELILAKNKYGSAIIKRFFKNYYMDVYINIVNYRKNKASIYLTDLMKEKEKIDIRNMMGETLRIDNGKFVLETKDNSNSTVIETLNKEEAIEFLILVDDINYIKG